LYGSRTDDKVKAEDVNERKQKTISGIKQNLIGEIFFMVPQGVGKAFDLFQQQKINSEIDGNKCAKQQDNGNVERVKINVCHFGAKAHS
jgi:hypothetical protein